MNIAHNFAVVADAPLISTSIMTLLQQLSAADHENRYYVIVSKQAKPGYTTTAYSESGHVLYRAKHSHSIQQFLKVLADEHFQNIRVLSSREAY